MKDIITKIKKLGTYFRAQCDNCGKWNGNWAIGTISYIDCDCLLEKHKGRYRTIINNV